MQAQQALGDNPLDAEEQDVAQRHDKGRRDDGQQGDEAEQPLAGHIQPGDDIGEQECHRRTGDCGDQRHEEAVLDGGEPAGTAEQFHIGGSVREQDHLDHRIDHEQPHERDDSNDRQQQKRLVFQPLHLFERLSGRCADSHGRFLLSGAQRLQKRLPMRQAGAFGSGDQDQARLAMISASNFSRTDSFISVALSRS